MYLFSLFFLHSRFYFPHSPSSECSKFHTSSIPPPHPHLHKDVPTPSTQPIRPLSSLGPPFSWGLGTCSLNEHRPGNPLLYMCWRPHISWYMLPAWWSSVWEISWVQVNWDCWSSYTIALLLSFFQLFPNSTTGFSSFSPLVGCKYLHLTLPAAFWVFQRAIMIGPFLWVP